MFEKLFGKASDIVHHTIGPYAVERQGFLEHCREQGYRKNYLKQIAGVLLAAGSDLHAHGGLDVDRARLEAANPAADVSAGQFRSSWRRRCNFERRRRVATT